MRRSEIRKPEPNWVLRIAVALVTAVLAGVVGLAVQKPGPAKVHIGRGQVQSPGIPTSVPSERAVHDEVADDNERCLANTESKVRAPASIQKWVDRNGVVHFSDTAPDPADGMRSQTIALQDVATVRVDIEARSAEIPAFAREVALGSAVAIAKIFKDVLGVDTGNGLSLRVVFAGTDAAFRQSAPGSSSSSGAYFPDRRTIVVRVRQRVEETLAVLRHEITHALVHEWIGRPPKALNEGLAEYFEHLQVQGMGASVDPMRYAKQLVRAAPKHSADAALRTLLTSDRSQFHGANEDANYTQSLGLLSMLMADASGRAVLTEALREQRRQPCRPIDLVRVFDRTWPNGTRSVAAAWLQHQRAKVHTVHAY